MKKIQEKYFKLYVRFIKDNFSKDKIPGHDYSFYRNIIENQYDKLLNYEEYFPHCYDINCLDYNKYIEFIFDEFYKDIENALNERLKYISNSNFKYSNRTFNCPKEFIQFFLKTGHLTYGLEKLDNINCNVFNFSYDKTSYDLLNEYFFD